MNHSMFFTQTPAVLTEMSILDELDLAILLRILGSQDHTKRISFRDLSLTINPHKLTSISKIQYSIHKLVFANLIVKINTKKLNGNDSSNIYKFNPNRCDWRLYESLRRRVNYSENLYNTAQRKRKDFREANLTYISSNVSDLKDHYLWFATFERNIPVSYRKFVDANQEIAFDGSRLLKASRRADFMNLNSIGEAVTNSPMNELEEIINRIATSKEKIYLDK